MKVFHLTLLISSLLPIVTAPIKAMEQGENKEQFAIRALSQRLKEEADSVKYLKLLLTNLHEMEKNKDTRLTEKFIRDFVQPEEIKLNQKVKLVDSIQEQLSQFQDPQKEETLTEIQVIEPLIQKPHFLLRWSRFHLG